MEQENSRKWLQAIKDLQNDANKQVLCPICQSAFLITKDVNWPDDKKCDRYFICPSCNSYNTVTFFID